MAHPTRGALAICGDAQQAHTTHGFLGLIQLVSSPARVALYAEMSPLPSPTGVGWLRSEEDTIKQS